MGAWIIGGLIVVGCIYTIAVEWYHYLQRTKEQREREAADQLRQKEFDAKVQPILDEICAIMDRLLLVEKLDEQFSSQYEQLEKKRAAHTRKRVADIKDQASNIYSQGLKILKWGDDLTIDSPQNSIYRLSANKSYLVDREARIRASITRLQKWLTISADALTSTERRVTEILDEDEVRQRLERTIVKARQRVANRRTPTTPNELKQLDAYKRGIHAFMQYLAALSPDEQEDALEQQITMIFNVSNGMPPTQGRQ